MVFFSPPLHSCEPSLDAHIKIIEVLVTSEWSESQAAPGTSFFTSNIHKAFKWRFVLVLTKVQDGIIVFISFKNM